MMDKKNMYSNTWTGSGSWNKWRDSVERYGETCNAGMKVVLKKVREHKAEIELNEVEFDRIVRAVKKEGVKTGKIHHGLKTDLYDLIIKETIGTSMMFIDSAEEGEGWRAWKVVSGELDLRYENDPAAGNCGPGYRVT